MNNSYIKIKYGDVAPDAKENFNFTSPHSKFDTLHQLKEYDLAVISYDNPCEQYQTVLDGKGVPFPSNTNNVNFGLWSKQVTDNNGNFGTYVKLTMKSDFFFSSQGLTLIFDTEKNIYPTNLTIKWYQVLDNTEKLIDTADFTPDNSFYFCQKQVKDYNQVVIEFKSLNMPYNRLKLKSVDFGYGTYFTDKELKSLNFIQEVDPLSTQISINTVDFILTPQNTTIQYDFQQRQTIDVYLNDKIMETVFITDAKQTSPTTWNIKCEDYIGIMEDAEYHGGMFDKANASDVLEDIFNIAKVPYNIDNALINETITGYIPYTNCRDALMQVAFAIQAVVDTSYSDCVKVFKLNDIVKEEIPLSRIMQGQNFDEKSVVTQVSLTAYQYNATSETVRFNIGQLYDLNTSVLIKFSEPLNNLSITNGTIEKTHVNYAIVKASNTSCVLTGHKYSVETTTRTKNNDIISLNTPANTISINNATLISVNNVDKVLNSCYNWLIRRQTTNAKIVERKIVTGNEYIKWGNFKWGSIKWGEKTPKNVSYDNPIVVGDKISVETSYKNLVTGYVTKQKFKLSGGIVVKEVEIK